MTGLTNRTLAMVQELLERRRLDLGPEEHAALRAVERLALSLARHLEEDVAEPAVGRVGEPLLPENGVLEVDERLAETFAEHVPQLRVVLRLLVRRVRRIAEVHPDDPDAGFSKDCVSQHP